MTSQGTSSLIGCHGGVVRLHYNILFVTFCPPGTVLSIKSGCMHIFKGNFDHVVKVKQLDSGSSMETIARRMLWQV